MTGRDGRVRCKDAGSLDMRHIGATEDAAARRPARPGGTRLHSGTSSPTPSKLSLAEQPPCKRKAVGSIPTWGSSPPRSPTWQRHPAQNRTSRGSNPRGGTLGGGTHGSPASPLLRGEHHRMRRVGLPAGQAGLRRHSAYDLEGAIEPGGPGQVVTSLAPVCGVWFAHERCDVVQWQDVRLLPGERWFDPSRRSAFLGRLTAGSSALTRRMRGSNPARGARSDGRGHGVQAVSNAAGEGSIPSVRARK